MNPLRNAFDCARSEKRPALVAYVMAGDPTLDATRVLVPRLVEAGADVIELGLPFSDPIADGPVLQAAATRALAGGATVAKVLELARSLKGLSAPVALMGYVNPMLAYGEERFAMRVAQAIDRARRQAPLTSTAALAELVRSAIPAATRRHGGHPAKRTFQALRIEVNGELDALRAAVPEALDALVVGGRIVVLSYQSLEDRIVKQSIAALAKDTTPVELPMDAAAYEQLIQDLTKKYGGKKQLQATTAAVDMSESFGNKATK